MLFGSSASVTVGRTPGGDGAEEFLVLPNADHPRLLVPARPASAAAAAVRHRGHQIDVGGRATRAAMTACLRTGLAQRALADRVLVEASRDEPSVLTFVRDTFGADVAVSVQLGPIRVHETPTLDVLAPSGRTIAVVKVGWNRLTRALIHHEERVLRDFAGRPCDRVASPPVMASASIDDFAVLALAPTPGAGSRPIRAVPLAAMRSLAAVHGPASGLLAHTPLWQALREWDERRPAVALLPEPGRLTAPTLHAYGDVTVQAGASHGGWTRENTTRSVPRTGLWNWEYFATGVPLGVDLVHWCVHSRLGRDEPHASGVRAGIVRAIDLLPRLGVEPDTAEAVIRSWAATLVHRLTAHTLPDEPAARLVTVLAGLLAAPPSRHRQDATPA